MEHGFLLPEFSEYHYKVIKTDIDKNSYICKKGCDMTQIIVTLDKDTNPLKLKNIIDGLKGVFSTTIKEKSEDSIEKEWADSFKRLNEMKIDPSLIDLDDDRTKYIMSK